MAEVGKHPWSLSSPTFLLKAGSARAGCTGPCHQFLNVSRDGDSTSHLGNLCQCMTTLTVKDFLRNTRKSKLPMFPLVFITSCPATVNVSSVRLCIHCNYHSFSVVIESNHISLSQLFLTAQKNMFSQAFLKFPVFQHSDCLCDPFNKGLFLNAPIFLVLGSRTLDPALQTDPAG